VQSIRTLATSGNSHSTTFGIVEAAAALLVLPFLARAKYTLALRIGSRALRADSLLTASGVALSAVALGALILHRAFGWWWVDPSSALAIAAILAWQGSLTLRQRASSLSSPSASG
jgi:divalent metal cation (Fe/Co/Zn/Cd) transporter